MRERASEGASQHAADQPGHSPSRHLHGRTVRCRTVRGSCGRRARDGQRRAMKQNTNIFWLWRPFFLFLVVAPFLSFFGCGALFFFWLWRLFFLNCGAPFLFFFWLWRLPFFFLGCGASLSFFWLWRSPFFGCGPSSLLWLWPPPPFFWLWRPFFF